MERTEYSGTIFTQPSERELAASRVFAAPIWDIWEAFTRPEHIARWMLGPEGWTMPVCEVDLRPGGAWHFVWRMADGEEMEMRGEYREVRAPDRLVNTENWGGEWPETLNLLELTERGGRTVAVATVVYPSKEALEKAVATGMLEGWAESNVRLDGYLSDLARRGAGESAPTGP